MRTDWANCGEEGGKGHPDGLVGDTCGDVLAPQNQGKMQAMN